jgi:sporulation protein YlmC with PRC-barrel domain
MRRTLGRVAALTLSLGLTTGACVAQVAGTSTLGVSVSQLQMVAVGYRASRIIGAPVFNDRNAKVGKIIDLVITPNDAVSYAIVSVGGFLGLGAKDVAVPARRLTKQGNKFVLPGATKQALLALPAFRFGK